MRDELNNRKCTNNECLILNIDHSRNNGTYWVAIFISNGVRDYFDSFGFEPPLEVIEYLKGEERYYTTFQIQKSEDVICGHFCIYVLYRLSNGAHFNDILDELYRYNE